MFSAVEVVLYVVMKVLYGKDCAMLAETLKAPPALPDDDITKGDRGCGQIAIMDVRGKLPLLPRSSTTSTLASLTPSKDELHSRENCSFLEGYLPEFFCLFPIALSYDFIAHRLEDDE